MAMHHFNVRTDAWPLVASDDRLIIVHRNQLTPVPVLYIGCHQLAIVEIRSALTRDGIDAAAGPAVGDPATGGTGLLIPAGGKVKFDLPGAGFGPLDLVTQISVLKGQVFVHISSFGVFDTYLRQHDVPSI